jgi:hypothetical protein
MSRFYSPISQEDLQTKIEKFKNVYELFEHVQRDIKVKFDLENLNIIGYHNDNGFVYLEAVGGGDWEQPVSFIIYWDGKKLRGYVPTKGNPWNSLTKEAYGNDEALDEKDVKKRRTEVFHDDDLMKKDISERILPIPSEKSLQERIKSLTFYGTGDEAYELFSSACSFCYSLYGLGEEEKAKTVCKWAEEMAKQSYEFAVENGDEDDFEKGRWGY